MIMITPPPHHPKTFKTRKKKQQRKKENQKKKKKRGIQQTVTHSVRVHLLIVHDHLAGATFVECCAQNHVAAVLLGLTARV